MLVRSRWFLAVLLLTASAASAQTTYTWSGSGSWATSTNWTPTRTTPATNDVLAFNNGGTFTVTGVPAQTIGQLQISGSTAVTLQPAATATTLTIGGGAGALSVGSGSALNISGTNTLTINLPTGSSGTISGSMSFTNAAHKLTAADASGITFQSGGAFTAGTGFSSNPFGTTSLNSIVFASGSRFNFVAGSNLFGATAPNSVVVFQTGSTYSQQSSSAPSFSGRTYANFEMTTGTVGPTGGSAVSIDNLTMLGGTMNWGMTGTGSAIKGNISVSAGATLNLAPASAATVNLSGSAAQSITNSGTLTFGANQTFNINNANGVTLGSNVSLTAGTLALQNGTLNTGANTLTIGASANVTRTNGYVLGTLTKTYAATGSKTFEVGTANGYSPVTVNVTGGSGDFTIKATQGAQPNVNASTTIARYWTLATSAITAADLTFQYLAGDVNGTESAYQAIRVTGGTPAWLPGTVNTGAHTVSVTGVTSFATDWTAGESNSPANVTTVAGSAGTYGPGQNVNLTATFDKNVFVTGTPRIPVTLNSGGVFASYVSGSGSQSLLFRYVVSSGDSDPDGIALGASFDTNGGSIKDGNGNDAATALNNVSVAGVLVDGVPPDVSSIVRAGTDPTAAASVNFTVTFSEAVTGVDAADFSLTTSGITGASITNVTGSGTTRTVTATTGSGTSGTMRLDLNSGATVSDLAGNAYAGSGFTGGETYTIDRNAPAVLSVTRGNGSPTNAGTVDFTVTFSQTVVGVDPTDFTLTTGGLSGASVGSVLGSGATRTVTVNTGSGDGTVRLDVLNDGTIRSTTGVPLTSGFTGGETYAIDRTAPTVGSVARGNANPTNAGTVDFIVTFSESVTGVAAGDFTIASSGITGASVGSVIGSGATRTVTVNTGSGDGTIRLDVVTGGAIVDAAGNALASAFSSGEVYTIDRTAPSVVSSVKASADPSTAATVDFTVTFSETVTGTSNGDFVINASGVTGASVAGVTGSGATRTVTVNTGNGNGTIRLDVVTGGTIIDTAGNLLASGFTAGESYTMQGTPGAPSALAATPGNAHVALTWSAGSGATTYNVKRGIAAGGPYTTLNSSVGTTSYDDLTAVNGTSYFYVVTSNGTRGESAASNEVSATPNAPTAASFGVVISQIYGGGGNSGATYKNDFIELFNRGNATVNLTGWSVQYASATGTSWQVTSLTGSIAPGHYFLIQEAAGTGGTTSLPTPDFTTGAINMSATAGKVLLANTTAAFSNCPSGSALADLAGFGATASCFEGSGPAPAPSNTNAIFRGNSGCTDTNVNSADFAAAAAAPRNSSSSFSCSGFALAGSSTPAALLAGDSVVIHVTVTPGTSPAGTGIAVVADLSPIGGSATQTLFDDATNGDTTPGDNIFSFATAVSGGTTAGVKAINVSATDAQARSTSTSFNITVNPSTLSTIAQAKVDGNSDTVPDLLGQLVKVRGVVTSIDFRSSTGIDYFIQDPTGGVDVFNSTTDFGPFTLGANVEVIGAVAQFNGLTEIVPNTITSLPGGTLPAVSPQIVTLSQLADGAGEPLEGQLVTVNNVTITSGSFPASGSSGNVTIADASGSGTLRINSATDIDGTPAPAGVFSVTGVVTQSDTTNPFSGGYQVQPRALTDLATQTSPAGSGSANPSSVAPGGTTLLTVNVSPGTNPPSTGIAVVADLTPIGLGGAQPLYDDGTHGDVSPNDGVFSFSATVGGATSLGTKSLTVTISDSQSRVSSTNITLTVQSATAPLPPANLQATAGNAQVALAWDASAGATGYNVKRSTTSGGPYATVATGVGTNSYTDTTVTNGTRYYFVVTATNPDESGPSNEATALPVAPPPTGSLAKVYFVDIGQGAATLIVSPTGKTLLVDGGPTGQGNAKVVPLLNTLGIATIDYTVLTHYHIDHDDGLLEVINAGRVAGTSYDNGDTAALIPPNFSTSPSSTYGTYARYVSALSSHTGTVTRVRPEDTVSGTLAGTVIDLGGGMRATLVEQGGRLLTGASVPISNQDLNTESISVFIEYNNFDFLVSGDMTGGGSTDTAKTADVETFVGQMVGDVDMLEFDHHGSTTANNRRFLKMLKAEAALAEAGYTNTFGHPNRETFNKFLNIPATSGNTYAGTGLAVPGNGPVAYQTDPSPAGDQRCTLQGYSGAAPVDAGNGTILLKTDGTTSFTMESFDDGGARISASSHVYALDATGAGITTNFPPTVIPSITPAVPTAADTVTIGAQVDDREDPITSVTLTYALNGVAHAPVTMTPAGGDLYSALIGAQPDGTRVDYTITGVAGGVSTSYTGGYFAGTTPISSLRAMDSLGSPVYWDYAARVQGTVTSGTGNFATGTNDDYLQDATGAINVWRTIQPSTPAVQSTTTGSIYSVAGLVGENGGRLRLEVTPRFTDTSTTPYGCTFISSGSTPAPLVRTIAQINASPESLEAYLVQINNCTVTSGTFPASGAAVDAFVTIGDGTGTMQLKIDHNTDIPGMATPAGSFTVVGIIQQDDFLRPFDGNYDVAPRNRVDVGGTASSGPGQITIADARVDVDANGFTPGDYVPDRLNQTVHIRGVVTSINFRTANGSGIEYYIEDATAGVDIFSTATTRSFSIGDDVDVIGTVKQFNGLTEIDPGATLANLTVLAPGTLPAVAPQLVTCSQLGDSGAGEPLEGRLLRINNVTLSSPPATWAASTNYTINDATGPCTIRISSSTNLAGQAPPAGTFSIIGVLGQFDSTAPFDSGYQFFPRSTSDMLPAVAAAASITATAGTPQTAVINTAFATQLAATVKDSGNATIGGAGVTFTAPASGASGTFPGSATTVSVITDANGLATAPPFTANGATGSYAVSATTTNALSTSFNLTNVGAAATHFTVSAPATVTSGTSFSVTVTALNAANATVAGYTGTVHFSSSASGTLPSDYTFTGGDAGTKTFSVTLTTAGSQTITATDSANSLTGTTTLVVNAPPATHLAVSAPATVTGGTAFSVSVTAQDASNATVTGYTGTVHFTSSSAGTLPSDYAFAAGDNGTKTFSVTLTTTGAQSITADDGSINGTANLTVNACSMPATPAIAATTNGTGTQDQACPEQPLTLTATSAGATSFQWYQDNNLINGATSATYQATGVGTYYVTATNTCGTTVQSAGYVVHNPTPHAPFITANGTLICSNGNVVLSSDSATGIQWYRDSVAIPGANAQSYTATVAGTYTAVLDALGCHSAAGNNVVLTASANPAPDATITAPATVVANSTGNTASVPDAGAGATYNWIISGGSVTAGSGTANVTFKVFTATVTITTTVTSSTGCSDTKSVTIPIGNPPPATHLSVTAPASVVSGTAFSVTVTALDSTNATVTGYTGTVHFSSTSAGTLPADYTFVAGDNGTHAFSVTLTTTGSQSITATDAVTNTITGSASTTVNLPPATHVSVAAPPTATSGTPFSLTVTALDASNATATSYRGTVHFTTTAASATLPADYTFTAADNGVHTFSASLTSTGTSTITATDAVTSSITGSASVSVGCPALSVTASNNGPVCAGGSIHLTATTAATGVTFAWSGPNGFSSTLQNPSGITVGGTYTVTMTAAGGCSTTSSTTVTINPLPPATITAPSRVCAHQPNISASVPLVAGETYAWSVSGGTMQRGANSNQLSFIAGDGPSLTVSVTLHGAAGCVATSSKTITVAPPPTATIPQSLAICGPANVTIPVTLTGTAPFSLTWSDGVTQTNIAATSTTRTFAATTSTTLSITAVSDATCNGSASNSVAISVDTPASITKQPKDQHVLTGTTATFQVEAAGTGVHHQWFLGTSGDTTTPVGTDSAQFTTAPLTTTQSYWVRVSNACNTVASVTVQAIPVAPKHRPSGH